MAAPTPFYRTVIAELKNADVPFLVGGAYALSTYTRINRRTKDLDLMIRQQDWPEAARALRGAGILSRLSYPHWLGKAQSNGALVDIIFGSGNGMCTVDSVWFEQAPTARILDAVVLLAPPEELIWSKAFVMERERFDGADVLHLIRALAEVLDWGRLQDRFSGHEEVLLSHLLLFRYAYPGEAARVPDGLVRDLVAIVEGRPASSTKLCRGTLLSRAQYLVDVSVGGLVDARRPPFGRLSQRELQIWTRGIDRAPQDAPEELTRPDTSPAPASASVEDAAKVSTRP